MTGHQSLEPVTVTSHFALRSFDILLSLFFHIPNRALDFIHIQTKYIIAIMIVFASMDQPDITQLELLETKSIPSGETVENTLLSPSKEDPINSLNVQNAGIIFFGVAVALRLLQMISNGRKHIKSL